MRGAEEVVRVGAGGVVPSGRAGGYTAVGVEGQGPRDLEHSRALGQSHGRPSYVSTAPAMCGTPSRQTPVLTHGVAALGFSPSRGAGKEKQRFSSPTGGLEVEVPWVPVWGGSPRGVAA